jgi:hypothetical protein
MYLFLRHVVCVLVKIYTGILFLRMFMEKTTTLIFLR